MPFKESIKICSTSRFHEGTRARIFKESMWARNQGGRGLWYRPASLNRLAEFIPWNRSGAPYTFKNTGSESQVRTMEGPGRDMITVLPFCSRTKD